MRAFVYIIWLRVRTKNHATVGRRYLGSRIAKASERSEEKISELLDISRPLEITISCPKVAKTLKEHNIFSSEHYEHVVLLSHSD